MMLVMMANIALRSVLNNDVIIYNIRLGHHKKVGTFHGISGLLCSKVDFEPSKSFGHHDAGACKRL